MCLQVDKRDLMEVHGDIILSLWLVNRGKICRSFFVCRQCDCYINEQEAQPPISIFRNRLVSTAVTVKRRMRM